MSHEDDAERPGAPSSLTCPVPLRHSTVQLAHGGGGRLTRELVERIFLPAFANAALGERHDSAVLDGLGGRVAFTTDATVVNPLFFPGGDAGSLAVCGTVNDLAMAGARPVALSAAFVVEEGFPVDSLTRIAASMRGAAKRARVQIVTGDTKVVDRGKGDGLYIATAGIGLVPHGVRIAPGRVEPGDAVLVTGDLGRHGVAVLSVREGLTFETAIESDVAPLAELVNGLLSAGVDVHCLRDATRGGLATALNEIALDGGVHIEIEETRVPVDGPVHAACELLGLDPLYVACEGRALAIVPAGDTERALAALRRSPEGAGAAIVGRVLRRTDDAEPGTVVLRSRLGTRRVLDLLSGEQLPRIC